MQETFAERIRKRINVFLGRKNEQYTYDYNYPSVYNGVFENPYRYKLSINSERTLLNSMISRMAIDVSNVTIKHVQVDDSGLQHDIHDSCLNFCFNVEANLDQSSKAFKQDIAIKLLDEGVVAVVPTVYTISDDGSKCIEQFRTATVKEWFPEKVKVEIYNPIIGKKEELYFAKKDIAIIENPFYSVMNEPNSTLKRLTRKLSLLDIVDEHTGSGKLDLIIQLPYSLKGDLHKKQAEERKKELEVQLSTSKYGIGYIDAAERITQLNRPVENNLLQQIEYLTNLGQSQLGMDMSILNGTASEEAQSNYQNRVVGTIVKAIVYECRRKFIDKDSLLDGEDLVYYSDSLKMIPVTRIAQIADSLTRNEIITSNECRALIGLQPSKDPEANVLRNKNLNKSAEEQKASETVEETSSSVELEKNSKWKN